MLYILLMNKIRSIIWKDVTGENESNRVSYIVRINSLLMCFYFIVLMFVFASFFSYASVIFCAVYFAIYTTSVYLTYKDHNKIALSIYAIATILWMIFFVYRWGWESSIQHFVFVLLILVFVGTYASELVKFILSLGILALRLMLYGWHIYRAPVEVLPFEITFLFQIINITEIFAAIIIIMSIFTKDKMETEAKLAQYNRKLKIISEHDPLTKLPNRRSLLSTLISDIMHGKYENGICVAMTDIDFFKQVNDRYGHDAGDAVLKQMAELFSGYMRKQGVAGRWGGEEFLLVFNNMNLDQAGISANELLDQVRNMTVNWHGTEIKITLTMGVTDINTFVSGTITEAEVDDRINEAIQAADRKLYMGKAKGRNTVVI